MQKQKLYHGTTETIAKIAPLGGIKPYIVPHQEGEITFSDGQSILLTNFYGALQAFSASNPDKLERWAIIEIWHNKPLSLEPCTDLLRERFKYKGKLSWQISLDMIGLCLHLGAIPATAIGKIWIFDPRSNWLVSRSVLHTVVSPEAYAADRKKLEIINRWLTGDFVFLDDWLDESKEQFTKEQKDQMSNQWNDRSGLDLFYQGHRFE